MNGCEPGRTGIVVVPDRTSASELRSRLATCDRGRSSAIRADAIQDWATFVRGTAAPSYPVATRRHSALIILKILSSLKLRHFGEAARSYSSAEGFTRTILKLKENLVGPKELTEIVDGLGEQRPRERDLIRVYESYRRELSRLDLLDEADLTLLALANASKALSELKMVAFDEFVVPTPAQLAMIRTIKESLQHAEVAVTCPTAAGAEGDLFGGWLDRARDIWGLVCDDEESLSAPNRRVAEVRVCRAQSPAQEARHVALMVAEAKAKSRGIVVASRPQDSFLEWYLSEAHSMELLPEHPTLDGARGSPFAHGLISPEAMESLPESASLDGYVGALLGKADVKRLARLWIKGLKERRGHGRVAARSLNAAAVIEETLRALSASSGLIEGARISRDQFAQLLSDELRLRTASSTMLDAVLPFRSHALGSPLANEADYLICTRMTEGSFPSRSGETLFFGDWQEESIRRIFPDAEEVHSRESYAFETMLKKCGATTLIMPAADDAGSETIPSPFAERFLNGGAPEPLTACILDRTESGRSMDILDRLFEVELARSEAHEPEGSPLKSYLGVLDADDARDIVRRRFTENELAPTALERYGNCPFSFFAKDVLRIEEMPEETPQIRRLDRGRMVHEALTRYYRDESERHGEKKTGGKSKANAEERIQEIVARLWEENSAGLDYVSDGLREREADEISKMAAAVIRVEEEERSRLSSPLRPSNFEWAFGRESENGLSIPVQGDEPLLVRGRVDRVDVDSDASRFLVIDYKSGGADQVVKRIETGEHLQLPLYIDAVRNSLYPGAVALGGLLLVIKEIEDGTDAKKTPGKTKGLVLKEFEGACYMIGRSHAAIDEERMEHLIETARERSAEFAGTIRRGIFAASGAAKCRNCDYGDICRYKPVSTD